MIRDYLCFMHTNHSSTAKYSFRKEQECPKTTRLQFSAVGEK